MTTSVCCGPGWAPPLPHLRQGDPAADHRPDHRPGHGPARGHPHPGHGPGDPGQEGEHAKIFEDARKSGYVRCRVDGIAYDLTEEIKLEKNKKHNIEIVVDRLVIREDIARRLTDSVETAASLAGGLVVVNVVGEDRDILFSQNYACEDCGISIEELTPGCSPSTTPSAPAPPAPAWAAR